MCVCVLTAVKVAVASGIANARELIEEIRAGRAQYDFVEVRQGGGGVKGLAECTDCIGGGGQHKLRGHGPLLARTYHLCNSSTCVCTVVWLQVMSCPGGCIGGGGQPKTRGHDVLQKRMDAVYNIDQHAKLRKSHENPEVKVRSRHHGLLQRKGEGHLFLSYIYTDTHRPADQANSNQNCMCWHQDDGM
jgi:iron only hydrogenase large subunit-like protein